MAENKIRVLIAGGTGLVGRHLTGMLDKERYEVYLLSRSASGKTGSQGVVVPWNVTTREISGDVPAPEIVINLAGEGIADGLWTESRKRAIISSRVDSAATLQKWLSENNCRPDCYIAASAVGYYGDRGTEKLTEKTDRGTGFLADSCHLWENASKAAGATCDRTCILRIGIVLSSRGGALPKFLMTRFLRIFGYFGDGSQYYPWIHITDLCRMIIWCMENRHASGIYNAVSPAETTCRQLTGAVSKATGRFGVLLGVPAFIMRLLMGEMSTVLLNSDRVVPEKLQSEGFGFGYPDVSMALKDILQKKI